MRFEWDENENQVNIKKHGVDFTDAKEIFNRPTIEYYDPRAFEEDRWQAIGMAESDILYVVYIETDEDTYRIISARKAETYEQEAYYKKISG